KRKPRYVHSIWPNMLRFFPSQRMCHITWWPLLELNLIQNRKFTQVPVCFVCQVAVECSACAVLIWTSSVYSVVFSFNVLRFVFWRGRHRSEQSGPIGHLAMFAVS